MSLWRHNVPSIFQLKHEFPLQILNPSSPGYDCREKISCFEKLLEIQWFKYEIHLERKIRPRIQNILYQGCGGGEGVEIWNKGKEPNFLTNVDFYLIFLQPFFHFSAVTFLRGFLGPWSKIFEISIKSFLKVTQNTEIKILVIMGLLLFAVTFSLDIIITKNKLVKYLILIIDNGERKKVTEKSFQMNVLSKLISKL